MGDPVKPPNLCPVRPGITCLDFLSGQEVRVPTCRAVSRLLVSLSRARVASSSSSSLSCASFRVEICPSAVLAASSPWHTCSCNKHTWEGGRKGGREGGREEGRERGPQTNRATLRIAWIIKSDEGKEHAQYALHFTTLGAKTQMVKFIRTAFLKQN